MADEADTWAPPIMPPDAPGEGRTPYLFIDKFPAADILLNAEDASVDTFTMFDCYQEALDWRSNLAQREHRVDHTIPRSVHQKKAMVKLLFIAFKSIACANDNEPMIAPFREHKHDNGRVEVLCWMLLEAAIRRSEYGPLLFAFNPEKAKYNSHLTTFAERFDEMIKSIATSKTICKHLYDAPYPNHFVDDPVQARKRVRANRELNKRKGAMMAQGRKTSDETKDYVKKSNNKKPYGKLGKSDSNTNAVGLPYDEGKSSYNCSNDSFSAPAPADNQDSMSTSTYISPYEANFPASFGGMQSSALYDPDHNYMHANLLSGSSAPPSYAPVNPFLQSAQGGPDYTQLQDLHAMHMGISQYAGSAPTPMLAPTTTLRMLNQPYPYVEHSNGHTAARDAENQLEQSSVAKETVESTTTPQDTPPRRINPPRSASTPNLALRQASTGSTDSDKYARRENLSDDDDPDWNPDNASPTKRRRR